MYLISYPWNYFLCRESTMNLLSLRDSTIVFPNFLWIHYLFRDFLWIHYLFHEMTINSHHFRKFTTTLLIVFVNSLWMNCFSCEVLRIHYLFREFTIDLLSFSRKHYRSVIFVIKNLWIHYLLWESTMNPFSFSRMYYLSREYVTNSSTFREFTFNSLSISRNHCEFTIFLANSQWIYFFSCEYLMNRIETDLTCILPVNWPDKVKLSTDS